MSSLSEDPFDLAWEIVEEKSEASLQKLRRMISEDEVDVNAVVDESSLFGRICEAGDLDTVRLMIAKGAIVSTSISNPEVSTALMDAVAGGNIEIVKLLVELGADVNDVRGGSFPLMIAAEEGYQDIFDYLFPLTNRELQDMTDEEL